MFMYTRSRSTTGTSGIYYFPLQDWKFPKINHAAPIVLPLLQKHMKIPAIGLERFYLKYFRSCELLSSPRLCFGGLADNVSSRPWTMIFLHYGGPLLGLARAGCFNSCTLSGSGADGSDGATPGLGILEDGYFPALGSEVEDLPQNCVCWEPPAAAQWN